MAPEPSSSLIVNAIGVHVAIDLERLGVEHRAGVRSAWEGAHVSGMVRPQVTVSPDIADGLSALLSTLSSSVTQAAIEHRRGELWMLHAAGLAARDGGVVVLVGPSGAGKTTATRLLARSWGYVSDETVGIEADGAVRSYRKPLSVITEGHDFKVQHAPRDLGLLPLPSAPLRVRRLVLLDRDPVHARARLVPVPASEALVLLAPHSSALASMSRPLSVIMSVLTRTGGALRAEYAEAEQLVDLIGDLMVEDLHRGPIPDDASSPVIAATPRPPSSLGGRRYRRGVVVDAHPLPEDRLAVLTGEIDGRGTLRVLAGAAPAIWRAADDATRDDLLHAATGGAPDEEAARAIDGILEQLVHVGLLTVTADG